MEITEYQEKLAEVRKEIDEIDRKLLPLFLKRMQCSEKVAALKREAGAPVLNAGREQEILAGVREKGGDYGAEAEALYRSIMSISRMRQHKLLSGGEELRVLEREASRVMPERPEMVVCQGVEGAYSHQAALSFFGEAPISFAPTWKQVFEDVKAGRAQFGVLPVENSAAGSVTGVYDLILRYRFFIVGAEAVRVEHCLAAADRETPVTAVVSHPQALSQCAEYLESHGLKAVEYSNTAAAAKYVAEQKPKGVAALCSREAARQYRLSILEENVQDEKDNTTRFVIISKEPIFPENAEKISLCFSLPHTPGALHTVLARFALCGLNMTKIESQPIPDKAFTYDFYLDFTGNIHETEALNLICALHDELPRFSFLGNYCERSTREREVN
ncbi:prephenate dehydratase [Neglectibacter caecimuris]|uniref:prephenate dehydratase n=1 Tax=Neglectibacter caecimuris TaxID=3093658 RepID=UPI002AC8C7D4|nr:prephenate dehydratase [Neglectibacter sp. M00184]